LEGTSPDETSMLLTIPMFTAAGLYHGVTRILGRGGKFIVMRQFEPRRALELIVRHRVLQFGGTPVVWEQMAKLLPEIAGHDFSHMRFAMVGGGRLSNELIAAFQRRGINIRLAYGLTEAGGTVSFPRLEDIATHPGTSGDGGIFAEVKAVRPNGETCDPGEVGEFMIRGPFNMRQYWNEPNKTAAAFNGDWLYSGDIGTLDKAGRIRFVDRISNLIKSGNHQISPNKIETALSDISGLSEIAVIAVPDTELGNKVAAIAFSETGVIEKAQILNEARRKLEEIDIPHYVILSQTPLPRLANGKLDRKTLRHMCAGLGGDKTGHRSAGVLLGDPGQLRDPQPAEPEDLLA
jgi:fatty-acyl-CoA synthase